MPNGSVLPSCFVCKWAKKYKKEPNLIDCQQYGFSVWLPLSHVCTNLGDPYEGSGLCTFAEDVGLEGDKMYAWFDFSYRTSEAPSIPQYRHELVPLTSFQEFSNWTIEE